MIFYVIFVLISSWLMNFIYNEVKFKKQHKLLPGPINFPIIGALLQVGMTVGEGQHYEKFTRLCKKYGSPMMMKIGVQRAVVATDYESVKAILCSDDCTARFPSHIRYREHMLNKYLGVLSNAGEPWREVRKFTIRTLRHFGFGELRTSEQFFRDELGHLIQDVDRRRLENNNVVDMYNFSKLPSLNIMWRVVVGHRFPYSDKKMQHIMQCVVEITRIHVGLDLEWSFPMLRYIPGFNHSRSKRQWFVDCFELFQGIIDERRATGEYKNAQTNFIDHFLYKIDQEKENNSEFFTDEQLLVTCNDLLFAGVDTAANIVEWALLYLLVHPKVQKKLQDEIDTVIGKREPTLDDRINMPYAEAVVLEVLRLANILQVMSRTTTCDTEINGCFVPKDTMCGLVFAAVHKDPAIWGDPENFRPERFLDENMNIVNDQYIVAFGKGKRFCPGYAMGKAMWFMFVITLLQRYNLSIDPSRPTPSLEAVSGIISAVRPHHCIMTLRENHDTRTDQN